MMKNISRSKKLLIAGGVILILIIAVGVWFFSGADNKMPPAPIMACEPLTPFALQELEAASGQRPISGKKCQIFSLPKGFLVKLVYDNAETVAAAKLSLVAGAEGEKKMINGVSDWVVFENDSAVFLSFSKSNPTELGILVLPDTSIESEVKDKTEDVINSGAMLAGWY